MSLPKQVQAQLEEAERLEQALAAELQAPDPDPETPPVEPEPEGVLPEVEPVLEPEAPQPEPPTPTDDAWQDRYKSIKGKYDAEVPRLQSEINDLRNQLQTALARIDKVTKPTEQAPQPLVTDKDVEAFGSDLIDVIARKAREVAQAEFAPKIAQLEAENAQLSGELNGVSERQTDSARAMYFADLRREVPDWEALNVDQRFMDWLAEVDPLSGYPRQEYLNRAFASLDVGRTAVLFNTFKELSAPPPTQAKPQPSKQLQRQVAPGTSRASTAATADANSRIWLLSEIDQFYNEIRRGDFKGREAEQVRIEAEIDHAVAEGRIRQ